VPFLGENDWTIIRYFNFIMSVSGCSGPNTLVALSRASVSL
jgi:hypothetical protein